MAKAKKHIFVINDVDAVLDVMRDLLQDEGYNVSLDNFSDRDLSQTVQRVSEAGPDAIILDLMVGDEAMGWQLLQLFKLNRDLVDIPVIVCTASIQKARELGAHLQSLNVAVVYKPFDIDVILEAVASVIEIGKVDLNLSPQRSLN